ncbi:MAG TPA: hypothetical protein ENK29_05710 [Chromatiales bacterium]|nr:hypothetical protein [Chromatiales bacterium]
MKKLLQNMIFFLAALPGAGQALAVQPHLQAVDGVVGAYLDAQVKGDVSTLSALMCGPLLEKRQPLLDNPGYPAHLVNAYLGARYSLVHHQVLDTGDVKAEISVTFPGREPARRQLLLKRTASATWPYCIAAESDAI